MIWLVGGLVGVVILQATVTPFMQIGGVRPDLFLLLLYLGSFKLNPVQACVGGFLLGLYQDALSGAPLGMNALTLSLLGYVLVRMWEEFEETRLIPHLLFLFLTGLCSGLITLGVLALLDLDLDLGRALLWIVLPQTIYTTAVGGLLLFGTRLGRVLEVRL
ncbi:MAG: rod shape-determining protein MreD [Candidatus Methylomirabilales bacterium]